ncbi:NUDIX hydrolase [Streptomyces sp. SBT349]|uniref:NUDIX hydrolase n=1 Tax=Streptomyces sp. SBT349 TaxID=1580539 RepID=UPI000D14B540|nr:NUDIX domain-containing protein [Streptomyces sp. SBT349]
MRQLQPIPGTGPTPRPAARIVVVDPEGAVFLFRYETDEVGQHWANPGGGLDPGETPREAARRELREETGWTDVEPGPLLCTWQHDYTRDGIPVRQHEHAFAARGPRREPVGDLLAAHAADRILGWRWWPREELRTMAEALRPPQLPALLDRLDPGDGGGDGGRAFRPVATVDLGFVPEVPTPAARRALLRPAPHAPRRP